MTPDRPQKIKLLMKKLSSFIACVCIAVCVGISFTGYADNVSNRSETLNTSPAVGTEGTTAPHTVETTAPPAEGKTDEIIASLVHIQARPDFAFRYDLTNSTAGEKAPIVTDYYLSAYKVTNAQYAVFIAETSHKAPSYWKNGKYPEGKADHPVLNISYSDAVSYCNWLSAKYDDWTFRLPTEAEWENAAYGNYYGNTSVKYPSGTGTPSYNASTGELTTTFNFNGVIAAKLFKEYGSNYIVNYIKGDFAGTSETLGECIAISANGGVSNWANHGGSAAKGYFLQTDLYAIVSADGGNTTPVGTYTPNTIGLYDMAGNCWDITSSVVVANNGLEQGVSCYAVRGGSWYATSRSCTLSYRGEGRKDSASSTVGFRIAADYTPGDLSRDGKVNAKDVVMLQRQVAGGYGVTIEDATADLNHDGKVNAKDIVMLQRFVAGGYGVALS